MAEPRLTWTALGGNASAAQVLVVGPSLGTDVAALWGATAERLADRFQVVGWDLPGHGRSAPTTRPFSVDDLATEVREAVEPLAAGRSAAYAGVSLGGGVGLALAVEPGALRHVTCIAGAASIGTPQGWHERAALVRRDGTAAVVAGSLERGIAAGFVARHASTADHLLSGLRAADDESYARACEALADLDLHARLAAAAVPLVVAAGEHDVVIPPDVAARTVAATPHAVLEVLAGCGHLPPAEVPVAVAQLLRTHLQEDHRG